MNNLRSKLPKLTRPDRLRRKRDPRRAVGYRGYRGEKGVSCGVWLAAGAILFLLSQLLWFVCGHTIGFRDGYCAFAQRTASIYGHITGVLPIPLSELVVGAVFLVLPLALIVQLCRRRRKQVLRLLSFAVFLVGGAVFLFNALFGVQHTLPPLAERMGLEVRPYPVSQLDEYVSETVRQANALSVAVPRNAEGNCDFSPFREISSQIADEYVRLAQTYPVFDRPMPGRVKRSVFGGRIMSHVNLAGYYFPWTAEAVVSSDVVQTHIPFNIAHETAHGLGIGPEAECNFAAWLACKDSDDAKIRYSAWICAYVYGNNALVRADPDAARKHSAALSPEVQHDLDVLSASLARFKGPVNKAGTAVNNALIQATGQPDGVRSYGKVIDLMVAYYFDDMHGLSE